MFMKPWFTAYYIAGIVLVQWKCKVDIVPAFIGFALGWHTSNWLI